MDPLGIGTRFASHGMLDIVGIIRGYIEHSAALSFCFDPEKQPWILWRCWDGRMLVCRNERSDSWIVVPKRDDYIRVELDIHVHGMNPKPDWEKEIYVMFRWDDHAFYHYRDDIAGSRFNGVDDPMLLYMPGGLREFYIYLNYSYTLGIGLSAWSYGIRHPWPEQYVTIRILDRRLYGLLPYGRIERIPYPDLDGGMV